MADRPLRIGTRASALALWQARFVQSRLHSAGLAAVLVELSTKGDQILDVPLAEIGDKALFTKELDLALLDGRIDLAVHSLKDLPTTLPEGLALAAVSEREDSSDVFVAHPDFDGRLDNLPEKATIATSSLRRSAQLKVWRRDLNIVSVRGNIGTRLQKLDDSGWHGMILAYAGLVRLGEGDRVRQRVPREIMVPAVSQGALGVVCRDGDAPVADALRLFIDHRDTRLCVTAERAFLRTVEGGCSVPVGASGVLRDENLLVEGVVASLDGSQHFRDSRSGALHDAEELGTELARSLLNAGADEVLADIRRNRASL